MQFLGFKPQLILITLCFKKLNKVEYVFCTSGIVCYCGSQVNEKCLLKMFNCGLQEKKIVICATESDLIQYAELYLPLRVFFICLSECLCG